MKVTLPTGIAPVEDTTVAVKVTFCPTTDGFGAEVIVVVVVAFETVRDTELELLPMYWPFPA